MAYSPPANRFPVHLDRHLDARSSLAARNNPHLGVLETNSVVRKTSKLSPQSCWQSHGGVVPAQAVLLRRRPGFPGSRKSSKVSGSSGCYLGLIDCESLCRRGSGG